MLNLLSLIDNPTTGSIEISSNKIKSNNKVENDLIRAKKIGIIYQDKNLMSDFTALENVYLPNLLVSKEKQKSIELAIERTRKWIVGMQSKNGGWGAFDIDNVHYSLNSIPFADHGALLDPPTADVSARCLSFLKQLNNPRDKNCIERATNYLLSEQEADGSWFGRWGTNYIYGTWSVLSALSLVEFGNKKVVFDFDGEMQPDVALNPIYQEIYPFSKIVGRANVLIMPALHSAAISTKLMKVFGGGKLIGPLLIGLGSPIEVAPLRASTSEILNLASIAAYSSDVIDYSN